MDKAALGVAPTVVGGGLFHILAKATSEVVTVAKSTAIGNVGDGAAGMSQQIGGMAQSNPEQVLEGRVAGGAPEEALEVPGGDVGGARKLVKCHVVGVVGFNVGNGVPKAKQVE